jgi:DNA-binding transcriptional MerR regulator
MQPVPAMTVGEVAKHFTERGLPVTARHVRRLFERELLPPAQRVGAYRVIAQADLPLVEKALREAGYLPRQEEAASAG